MLKLIDIKKIYNKKIVLKNISFSITSGEIVGIIGESGAGKSTLSRIISKLERPDEGNIYLYDKNITNFNFKEMIPLRRDIQMIFQNNFESLNPLWTVKKILEEPLINFNICEKEKFNEMVLEALLDVDLDKDFLNRKPHELSGGQIQRVCIARSIITKPKFIIADEPISSLDFILKKKILALFLKIKEKYDITYLFISHDLTSISNICNKIIILKGGEILEVVEKKDGHFNYREEYTKKLFNSIPASNPLKKRIINFI